MKQHKGDFMGIPPSLYNELRLVLLDCGPFTANNSLKAIFLDDRISPWRSELPRSNSETERVEAVIDLLYNKHNENQENALMLLLHVLLDRVPAGDSCSSLLHSLISKVEEARKPKQPSAPIHVFVADDHIHAVEGLSYIINREADMKVVGQANKKLEVLDTEPALPPDVIVLDLAWPGDMAAGITFIPQLKAKYPNSRIIAVTNYPELMEPARQAGALPLRKGFSREELLDTIRYAIRMKDQPHQLSVSPLQLVEPLTGREKEVLALLMQGITDKEIAQELKIAEGTVKKHVSNLLGKLGAKSRTEAAMIAERHTLL